MSEPYSPEDATLRPTPTAFQREYGHLRPPDSAPPLPLPPVDTFRANSHEENSVGAVPALAALLDPVTCCTTHPGGVLRVPAINAENIAKPPCCSFSKDPGDLDLPRVESILVVDPIITDLHENNFPDQRFCANLKHGFPSLSADPRAKVRINKNHLQPDVPEHQAHARQILNKLCFDSTRGFYSYLGTCKDVHALRAKLAFRGYSYGIVSALWAVMKSNGTTSRKVNDLSAPDKRRLKRFAFRRWQLRSNPDAARALVKPKCVSVNLQVRVPVNQGQCGAADFVRLVERKRAERPAAALRAAKLDLEDGYQVCRIPRWDRSLYLEIMFDTHGRPHLFIPKVWMFGGREAGFHFCRLAFAFAWTLTKTDGLTVISITDDTVLLSFADEAAADMAKLLSRARRWGLPVQLVKFEKEGRMHEVVIWSGLLFDLFRNRIEIPDKKCDKIVSYIDSMLSTDVIALKPLQKCHGHITAVIIAWPPLRAFTFGLRKGMSSAIASEHAGGHASVNRTASITRDLQDCRTAVLGNIGSRICSLGHRPRLALTQDASKHGAGGYVVITRNGKRVVYWWAIRWTGEELRHFPGEAAGTSLAHIGVLEFFAAFISLQLAAIHAPGLCYLVKDDNSSTVTNLESWSASTDVVVADLLRDLVLALVASGSDLSDIAAEHLPGVLNLSDLLSRKGGLETFFARTAHLGDAPHVRIQVPSWIRKVLMQRLTHFSAQQ